MTHLGPQFAIDSKEHENVTPNDNPRRKKPRNGEITSNAIDMTGNIKTQLCTKFSLGHCSYGNKCMFAHGIGEMRKPLPLWQGRTKTSNEDYRMENRSNLCRRFYSRKECAYGDRCRFVHVSPENVKREMWSRRESSCIRIGSIGFSGGYRTGFSSSKPVIKIRPCNNWVVNGSCPYGKICCFAHGQAELGRPGGDIELVCRFVPTNTSKTIPTGKNVIGAGYEQQVQSMKCTFKWESVQKMSGIYADWIEDMPSST